VRCGVGSSKKAPTRPPDHVRDQKPGQPAALPPDILSIGADAREAAGPYRHVLVTLAAIDGTPMKIGDGKARKPPPPAAELMAPAAMELPERRPIWDEVTLRIGRSG
jgi:hypothetical protein